MPQKKLYRILLAAWYGAVLFLLLSLPVAALGSEVAKTIVVKAHVLLQEYEGVTKIVVITVLIFYALENLFYIIREKSYSIVFDSRRIKSDYAIEIFFPFMAMLLFM